MNTLTDEQIDALPDHRNLGYEWYVALKVKAKRANALEADRERINSAPPPKWAQEELNDGDRICKAFGIERTEGGRLQVGKMILELDRLKTYAKDCGDLYKTECSITQSWINKCESAERRLAVAVGALERVREMAARPKCICGTPTGTAAIQACAIKALQEVK